MAKVFFIFSALLFRKNVLFGRFPDFPYLLPWKEKKVDEEEFETLME
jgi:hypothetical protein